MKNKVFKRKETKTLTEQVEDHFRYMGSKGWHKNKLRAWEHTLWRPEKKKEEVENEG
jgi:hypothetical protein